MSHRTFKRSKLSTLLGLATAGLFLATAPVHSQTSAADSQSGKGASSQMSKGADSSSSRSEAGKSSSGSSATGAQDTSTSGAGSTSGASAGSDSKAASRSSDSAGKMAKSDQEMMEKIAQTNIAEIETAKLAQEKSKNEEVRAFAQKMIDDHTAAQSELEKIAQSKGVTLPTTPDSKHQAALKKMTTLSDKDFDKQYMSQAGEKDHREAHKLLDRVSKQAKDEELKQYATKTIAAVDEHGKMAKEVKVGASGSTSSGSSAAGSSGSGADKAGSSSEKSGAGASK
jgi:putative membrane protein